MKKTFIIIALLVFGLSVTAMAAEKTIVYARPHLGALPLGPHQAGNSGRYENLNLVYDTPVTADGEGKVIPNLATSWKISNDWKVYDFTLRKGVKFHDGTPFNAEAFKFSFDRIAGIDNHAVAKWRHQSKKGAKIEVTGEYSVRFTFPDPYPAWLRELVYACYGIVSPSYIKKYATDKDPWAKERMAYDACGTGPFTLVEIEPRQKILFKRNPDYWGGERGIVPGGKRIPSYDKLLMTVVPDPTTRRIMLEKGEVDVAGGLGVDMLQDLQKVKGIKVVHYPVLFVANLYFNAQKKPFNDVRVRQALSYAIDYDQIVQGVEKGMVLPVHGLIPEGMMGYDPNKTRPYTRNVAKAKELLAAAGYPNGFTMSLQFSPERRAEFEMEAVLIQNFFKDIGVNMNIEKMAYSAQLGRQVKGEHDATLMTYFAGTGDPAILLANYVPPDDPLGSPQYSFRWRNEKVIELMRKGLMTPDGPQRAAIYAEVDEIGMKEAAVIPLYQIPKSFAMRGNISGFVYDTLRRAVWWEADKREG